MVRTLILRFRAAGLTSAGRRVFGRQKEIERVISSDRANQTIREFQILGAKLVSSRTTQGQPKSVGGISRGDFRDVVVTEAIPEPTREEQAKTRAVRGLSPKAAEAFLTRATEEERKEVVKDSTLRKIVLGSRGSIAIGEKPVETAEGIVKRTILVEDIRLEREEAARQAREEAIQEPKIERVKIGRFEFDKFNIDPFLERRGINLTKEPINFTEEFFMTSPESKLRPFERRFIKPVRQFIGTDSPITTPEGRFKLERVIIIPGAGAIAPTLLKLGGVFAAEKGGAVVGTTTQTLTRPLIGESKSELLGVGTGSLTAGFIGGKITGVLPIIGQRFLGGVVSDPIGFGKEIKEEPIQAAVSFAAFAAGAGFALRTSRFSPRFEETEFSRVRTATPRQQALDIPRGSRTLFTATPGITEIRGLRPTSIRPGFEVIKTPGLGKERIKFEKITGTEEAGLFLSKDVIFQEFVRGELPAVLKIEQQISRFPKRIERRIARVDQLSLAQKRVLRADINIEVLKRPGEVFPGAKTAAGLGQEFEFRIPLATQLRQVRTDPATRFLNIFGRGSRFTIDPELRKIVQLEPFTTELKPTKLGFESPFRNINIRNLGKLFERTPKVEEVKPLRARTERRLITQERFLEDISRLRQPTRQVRPLIRDRLLDIRPRITDRQRQAPRKTTRPRQTQRIEIPRIDLRFRARGITRPSKRTTPRGRTPPPPDTPFRELRITEELGKFKPFNILKGFPGEEKKKKKKKRVLRQQLGFTPTVVGIERFFVAGITQPTIPKGIQLGFGIRDVPIQFTTLPRKRRKKTKKSRRKR